MPRAKERPIKRAVILELISFVFTFGMSLIIPVILFIAGGIWLDNYLKLKPILTITGTILALMSVAFITYKEVSNLLKKL